MKPPKVKIEGIELTDNYYVNSLGEHYSVTNLIEHSKKYEPFDLPLAGIDLTRKGWTINDLDDFIYHLNRVNNTNLEHPIILDNCGVIADGLHRVCKAVAKGKRTIKAIRLETMPPYCKKEEKTEKT